MYMYGSLHKHKQDKCIENSIDQRQSVYIPKGTQFPDSKEVVC